MSSEAYNAIARGLAVLHDKCDTPSVYRIGASGGPTFSAILKSEAINDALGGTVTKTTLQATRSTLGTLPASGSIITYTGPGGGAYTLKEYNPGPTGEIILVVEAETR